MSMRINNNPDIDFPFVAVIVPYPGVSPEDSERLLVKPLEVELQAIEGLKEMNSAARQGMAIVNLEFEADFDKDGQIEYSELEAKVTKLSRSGGDPRSGEAHSRRQALMREQGIVLMLLEADGGESLTRRVKGESAHAD